MTYLDQRKLKIAASALNVFKEKGFTNTTMKDIMLEANVSRGGLYNHFDNIEAVFIESLKIDDEQQLHMIKLIDDDYFDSLWMWIEKMFDVNQNLLRAKMEFLFLYSTEDFPYLQERFDNLRNSLETFIDMGIESGQFKTINSVAFSEYLIASIDGLLLFRNNQKDNTNHKDYFKQSLHTLLKEA